MIALALALLASTQQAGPPAFDVFWVHSGKDREHLFRDIVKRHRPPAPEDLVALSPDASAAAIRSDQDAGQGVLAKEPAFRILPGGARIADARAAAFSPDGQTIAASLGPGRIVAVDLQGKVLRELGRMRGVQRLVWSKAVVAAGNRGALLLPNQWLTNEPVLELAAAGDRIAIATAGSLFLFDGEGKLIKRLRVRATAVALSAGGRLAYSAGRDLFLLDSPPRKIAHEHAPIRQVVFDGEEPVWVADGARRADGRKLDCATFVSGAMVTCPRQVVDWKDLEHPLYDAVDCFVHLNWAVSFGDGMLVASSLRDRRFIVCPGTLPKDF
jgi:hypothetical protein